MNIIKDEIISYSPTLQTIHEETEKSLRARLSHGSLLVFFDFPDEIRVPCEQYLLYFAKFLRDLGVEVETALTNEAGQVLFTVTPKDQTEALEKIRSALDVYLHLPSNPIEDATNESIVVQRLEATILRFRADLKLASAELRATNATIEAQQLIIDVQKKMLNGEILIDSVKDVTPKHEDKEYLIDGLVALSTYEDKGLALHLGEMLRRLKQLFKKSN
jgi:archaellum biogenesis ATPase FlaH